MLSKLGLVGVAVVTASLATNVALTLRARVLESDLAELNARTAPVAPVGLTVTPLTGVDGNGASVTIDQATSTKPTVLYVLAPTCKFCEQNLDNILALARSSANTYRFIGVMVSREVLPGLQDRYPFPIIGGVEASQLKQYGFTGTPQTLVLDSAGVIQRNWLGAYRGTMQEEVERWFGVRLPGLVVGAKVQRQVSNSPVAGGTTPPGGRD
ncbi:MAG TPA: hypothetical protein VN700_14815 [Vicinamibacterales bacterium]|nr:hypothetical protein [Vicinamibacterales bacterium]